MRFFVYVLLLLLFLFLVLMIDLMYAAGYNMYKIVTLVTGVSRLGELWTTLPFYAKIIVFLILVGLIMCLVTAIAYAIRALRR